LLCNYIFHFTACRLFNIGVVIIIYNMKVMCFVVLTLSIGCITHLAASELVCFDFCSRIGMSESCPGKSCADIYKINKATRGVSRDYWVNTTTGTHQVYKSFSLLDWVEWKAVKKISSSRAPLDRVPERRYCLGLAWHLYQHDVPYMELSQWRSSRKVLACEATMCTPAFGIYQ